MTDPRQMGYRDGASTVGFGRPTGSSPAELARASRVGKAAVGAFSVAVLVGIGGVAFGATSVTTAGGLRWVTGIILVALLAATWLLCAHAGGHAWFVPLPALVLAVLWAVTVTGDNPGTAWWFVALSSAAAAVGVAVAGTALRQRLRSSWMALPGLRGASGTAQTALSPIGVVRVAGESWTAKSMSGPLPAGSPVHVVRVDGVRLDVWSEAGAVPDIQVLENEEER